MVCASAPELRAALDGLTRGVSLDMLDDCAATAGAKHLAKAATKRVHANHSPLGGSRGAMGPNRGSSGGSAST